MKFETPEKPTAQKDQIAMMWESLYNHIPHKFQLIDLKMNFLLSLVGIEVALIAAVIVLAIR